MTPTREMASRQLQRWREEGHDLLAIVPEQRGEVRVVPTRSEDVPPGAVWTYVPIASSAAHDALMASWASGWDLPTA